MNAEAIRRQLYGDSLYDKLAEEGVFDDPGISCPPEEEVVRKEFQRETDVAYQLQRFGAGQAFPFQPKGGVNGMVNYDVDRLVAHEMVSEASALWEKLPAVVREKYATWEQVEEAAATGELDKVLSPPEPVKEVEKS